MKNFCAVFALFCTVILISCGGGSSKPANESGGDSVSNFGKLGQECYPNKNCDEGLLCDEENNVCVEDPENPINDSDRTDSGSDIEPDTGSDSDGGDSAPDNGDTTHDSGDSAPDNGDTTHDSGDSQPDGEDSAPDNGDSTPDEGDSAPDSDETSPANENPDNLPECSPTSTTPCIDSETVNSDSEKTNLIWSGKSPENMHWADAVDYCKKLNEGGYSDWQLPTLAALKTLVRTCGSGGYSDGECSKFGDIVFLWSSSTNGSSESQGVFFYNGAIQSKNVDETFNLRCVRREGPETREVNCKGLPEQHAEWNTVSQITQTWNWNNVSWLPSQTSIYSEIASAYYCIFKCEENYLFNSYSNQCLNPCNPNPCDEVANSTKVCTALAWNEYRCGCVSGYHWWGPETGCTDKKSLGEICTGQTQCYNESDQMACPTSESESYFGQDAYYANLDKCTPQNFTVQMLSNQNIVLDNNTGLMWQQTIPTSTYTWEDAGSYCDSLTYAGYSDWRLPTPQELQAIVDNSKYNPAIDTTYFPDTPGNEFWSSSTITTDSTWAYYMDFNDGYIIAQYLGGSYSYYVRCVRGTNLLPTNTFNSLTVNGEVIVTDSKTGLVWQKTCVSGKTWTEALSYCEGLTYAGYSDWRLPNKNELVSLVNYGKSNPASDFPPFMISNGHYYWSSSTTVEDTSRAWLVDFQGGHVYGRSKTEYSSGVGNVSYIYYYVRCVRNAD